MLGVFGFGGVQLLLLGVLGEYLGRIYYETRRRPPFLVKEASEPVVAAPHRVRSNGSAPRQVVRR